ncbi:hypothetical protein [Candidatus Venteria ishoeyi]|uniref:Uncharacterized protein n=1 Tax=Candidatus Venteria ishoeyi TaxID=1899563 RepID=A0A1H6F9H9_9GAMM|nr:hypothetical protein [Candidatus Venteria ishoeyi]MDM8545998.1 hypothetical protein [Candidatus Venteria ishoeyi]SEH06757.1 Uncharacterised protein [Candidatus Venteria ishoeyi]
MFIHFLSKNKLLALICLLFSVYFSSSNAAGQAAVIVSDTQVEQGELLGADLVLNGSGTYDVYVAFSAGLLGTDLYFFTDSGLQPWNPQGNAPIPSPLRTNFDLSQAISQRIIPLFPELSLADFPGAYIFYVGLTTPGQLDFPVLDTVPVIIE